MSEEEYKKSKYAACTTAPWELLIPLKDRKETIRTIKQESIENYGEDFTECPKRLVCIGSECIGRPLPWKSKTAQPYLEKLSKTQSIKDGELYVQSCNVCPIAKTCKSTCSQVTDFINRRKTEEAELVLREDIEHVELPLESTRASEEVKSLQVPWDVLPADKQQLVREYLYNFKDFKSTSEKLDLNNQARAKYEFYAALTRLSEFGVMRKFLNENSHKLTNSQKEVLGRVYFGKMNYEEVAKSLKITKQAVSNIVNRTIKKHNIKWTSFVTKKGKKINYNVPLILK